MWISLKLASPINQRYLGWVIFKEINNHSSFGQLEVQILISSVVNKQFFEFYFKKIKASNQPDKFFLVIQEPKSVRQGI